jgi:hypothetical protein
MELLNGVPRLTLLDQNGHQNGLWVASQLGYGLPQWVTNHWVMGGDHGLIFDGVMLKQ